MGYPPSLALPAFCDPLTQLSLLLLVYLVLALALALVLVLVLVASAFGRSDPSRFDLVIASVFVIAIAFVILFVLYF